MRARVKNTAIPVIRNNIEKNIIFKDGFVNIFSRLNREKITPIKNIPDIPISLSRKIVINTADFDLSLFSLITYPALTKSPPTAPGITVLKKNPVSCSSIALEKLRWRLAPFNRSFHL